MMIKWVMPLDYQTSLKTLIRVLYNDVVKGKIRKNYTERGNELITFRSRMAPEIKAIRSLYPFDDVEFSQSTSTESGKKADQVDVSEAKS